MSRGFFVKANALEFRGAGHEPKCQVKFAPNSKNYRKFTTICPTLTKLSLIILDPAETNKLTFWYNYPKLYLTSSAYYCIIGAANQDLAFGIFAQKG